MVHASSRLLNEAKSFFCCPGDAHPLSLTNLQVTIGGQNFLQSVINYNYEEFIEQVNYAEQ